jgi:hypothetical protein
MVTGNQDKTLGNRMVGADQSYSTIRKYISTIRSMKIKIKNTQCHAEHP